jgi:hypothetical protein
MSQPDPGVADLIGVTFATCALFTFLEHEMAHTRLLEG